MLVEVNDGCLSVAAELASRGAGGVAGLQRMSATQVLTALLAVTAVDLEFANDGLTRNLGLKLLIEMIFDDIAAAIGTLLGQRRAERFIDLGGRRGLATGVFAVPSALLASRLLGVLLRFTRRERGGLAFGGAFAFVEAALQIADRLLKPCNLLAQQLILDEQLLIGRGVHADLDSDEPCQLHEIIAVFSIRGKTALNKHTSGLFARLTF